MIKTNYHIRWFGQLAIFISIFGMSSFAVPTLAQVSSGQPSVKGAVPSGVTSRGASTKVTAQATTTASKNLVELAEASGSFETLLQAAQAAGLTETLAGKGPYTIFAPTDAAFAALPKGAVEAVLRPENRALLRQVLLYHVVPGEVTASELKTGTVKTLGGGVSVRVTSDKVIVNDGSVIQPDIQASNGVAHVINRVLIPPEIRAQLVSQ